MKINIEVKENLVDVFDDATSVFLSTFSLDYFLSCLDKYQLDAYYDGDAKFSMDVSKIERRKIVRTK